MPRYILHGQAGRVRKFARITPAFRAYYSYSRRGRACVTKVFVRPTGHVGTDCTIGTDGAFSIAMLKIVHSLAEHRHAERKRGRRIWA